MRANRQQFRRTWWLTVDVPRRYPACGMRLLRTETYVWRIVTLAERKVVKAKANTQFIHTCKIIDLIQSSRQYTPAGVLIWRTEYGFRTTTQLTTAAGLNPWVSQA